jgi:hypothetical protein
MTQGLEGWDANEPFEIKDYDKLIEEYKKHIYEVVKSKESGTVFTKSPQ